MYTLYERDRDSAQILYKNVDLAQQIYEMVFDEAKDAQLLKVDDFIYSKLPMSDFVLLLLLQYSRLQGNVTISAKSYPDSSTISEQV